jgi:hypothetical protein
MAPDTVTTIAEALGAMVMVTAVLCLAGAVASRWLGSNRFTWLYYAGWALAGSGLLARGTDAEFRPVLWVVAVKWVALIAGVALVVYARKGRTGYKPNPWSGAGHRGTYMLIPIVYALPPCLAWGLGWAGSLGGFAFSALTLDVPGALITGAMFMSYVGMGAPAGC